VSTTLAHVPALGGGEGGGGGGGARVRVGGGGVGGGGGGGDGVPQYDSAASWLSSKLELPSTQ